jgi:hypothetical protein
MPLADGATGRPAAAPEAGTGAEPPLRAGATVGFGRAWGCAGDCVLGGVGVVDLVGTEGADGNLGFVTPPTVSHSGELIGQLFPVPPAGVAAAAEPEPATKNTAAPADTAEAVEARHRSPLEIMPLLQVARRY